MKELSIKDKANRYDKAIEIAKSKIKNDKDHVLYEEDVIEIFPELKESMVEKPNGGIVLEDFNEGDGFYKVNLAYLSKEQVEEIESLVEKWNPELKESEDESIRKELINFVKSRLAGFPQCEKYITWLEKQGQNNSQVTLPPFMFDDILALQCCMETVKKVQEDKDLYEKLKDLHGRVYDAYQLEKQGEQKPVEWHIEDEQNLNACLGHIPDEFLRRWLKDVIHTKYDKSVDKIEPKFNMADWIVMSNGKAYQVISVNEYFDEYILIGYDGRAIKRSIQETDKSASIFTIQDAKDGDVLCTYECGEPKIVFILKGTPKPKKPCVLRFHCYYNLMYPYFEPDFEKGCLAPYEEDVKPATKEQRDLLFQKIEEAGFKWDAEKKELKSK